MFDNDAPIVAARTAGRALHHDEAGAPRGAAHQGHRAASPSAHFERRVERTIGNLEAELPDGAALHLGLEA